MNVITDHPAIVAIASYWIFSALVGGMPAPDATSSKGYTWMHSSLHIIAGNLSAAIVAKYPNLPSGAVQITDTVQRVTTAVPPTEAK